MSSTNINVRVDSDLKTDVQQVLGNLGMDLTTAISIYLKQIVYNRAIPFAVAEPRSPYDEEYSLRRAFAQYDAGERFLTLEECGQRMKTAIKQGASDIG